MKNKILSILCIGMIIPTLSQNNKVVINDISDIYYAEIKYKSPSYDIYFKGDIKIFNKHNKTVLIQLESKELLKNNWENLNEIKYKDQSNIIYEDFNFDGRKDFAILDSYSGPYGSPTYKIYLYQKENFTYNKSFSELAHQYMGIFQIDSCKKELITYKKSGCCFHEKTKFIIIKDNKLTPNLMIIDINDPEGQSGRTIKKFTQGKWVTISKTIINH